MVGKLKLLPFKNTQFGMLSRSQGKVSSRQLRHVDGKLPLALGREPMYLRRNHTHRQRSSQTCQRVYASEVESRELPRATLG